ncbi:MAG: 3-oxoacyl-[acyl-carrier-protein] synthase 2 [Phycisphaerae bacterium]|nr:MAG: beta-ketoacyl-[acyl-carrier-protein] synthase family protein [Planctomycetia bacterium]GJQ28030.1 MAG: 3-oxoacyl-[acyl-carrier-protein] synthase 2 [Phycisphaerae bacterium]
MSSKRVVITGLGVVSPLGIGIEPTFEALVEKRCGVGRITAFDPARFTSQIAGEVRELRVADAIPKGYRKAAKVMARDIELAVVAAYHAVKDAGLKTKCMAERGEGEGLATVDHTRFGANIGAGLICADLTELAGALATSAERPGASSDRGFSLKKWGAEGMNNLTPLWLLKFLPNMLACHVTIVHDCQGPSNTITCGEASSHLAIGEAYRTIQRGTADICICGGAESKLNPMGLMRQSLLNRLVTDSNDSPATACRPFDTSRKGTVISEGGGLLILEELEHAKKRGAKIYAELIGFGAATNASHWLTPQADGRAIAIAMRKALADAGATPEQVGLVNTPGIGTTAHDASEAAAIHAVLGDRAKSVPVLATKGSIGNNGAGSGAIDLAVAIMALKRGVIPPSLNTAKVDPACNLNVVRGDPTDCRADLVLSAAAALSGGQTAALAIRRYQE